MTLRNYGLNSSFHGLKFLAEKKSHWIDKLFWAICCILCWTATGLLIKTQYNNFQNNAISFVVDTNYLNWNTNFPSVTICERDNDGKIAQITDRLFGDPHNYDLDEIVKELVYYQGLAFYGLQTCGPKVKDPVSNCFKKNFSEYSKLVRSPCREIFRSCKWNYNSFNCCEYFQPIETEIGTCYSLNSLQSIQNQKLKMTSNRTTGPGTLWLEVNGVHNLYLMGEQELPTLTSQPSDFFEINPKWHFQRLFAVKEMVNQPEVKEISPEQRKCRFPDENDLDVYPYYSYSACVVQCRKNAQQKTCNCSHHLIPNTRTPCNFSGLSCLADNYNELTILKPSWATRKGLVCDCLPGCSETEISVIKDNQIRIAEDFAIVELSLLRLPTERFQRTVVRGRLDLVVSMGGSTALFLGASILSFVEVIFYFLIRPINDALLRKNQRR